MICSTLVGIGFHYHMHCMQVACSNFTYPGDIIKMLCDRNPGVRISEVWLCKVPLYLVMHYISSSM